MLVTESGMVISVKPVQPENAELPMLVTESGMVISVSPTTAIVQLVALPPMQAFDTDSQAA